MQFWCCRVLCSYLYILHRKRLMADQWRIEISWEGGGYSLQAVVVVQCSSCVPPPLLFRCALRLGIADQTSDSCLRLVAAIICLITQQWFYESNGKLIHQLLSIPPTLRYHLYEPFPPPLWGIMVSTGELQSLRMRVISVTLMANSLLLTSRSYRLELLLQRHKTHSVTHNIVRWF